jgi:hypothetical protein
VIIIIDSSLAGFFKRSEQPPAGALLEAPPEVKKKKVKKAGRKRPGIKRRRELSLVGRMTSARATKVLYERSELRHVVVGGPSEVIRTMRVLT